MPPSSSLFNLPLRRSPVCCRWRTLQQQDPASPLAPCLPCALFPDLHAFRRFTEYVPIVGASSSKPQTTLTGFRVWVDSRNVCRLFFSRVAAGTLSRPCPRNQAPLWSRARLSLPLSRSRRLFPEHCLHTCERAPHPLPFSSEKTVAWPRNCRPRVRRHTPSA